jgi:hypothetical protein
MLQDYNSIYLDIEDQYMCAKTSMEFQSQFNEVSKITLDSDAISFLSKIKKFFKINKFIKELIVFIKDIKPSIIITTSDMTLTIRVIKRYFPNILIIVIQSAGITNKNIPRRLIQKIEYIFFNKILQIPIISNQNYFGNECNDMIVLLWGEYFKNILVSHTNRYTIGNIVYDNFPIKKDTIKKEEILLDNNFDINSKIIVLCTTPLMAGLLKKEYSIYINKIYTELIVNRPNIFFIIKPHPRNNTQELKDYFLSLDVNNVIIYDKGLHSLFAFTDIHISSFSITSLEAVASDIPIISINPNNEIPLQDFLNNELDEKVINLNELIEKVDKLLLDSSKFIKLKHKFVFKKLYKLDGEATQRAVDIITEKIL